MLILSVFAYLSCAMKEGAPGELSMGSSSASLHLVPHQSDRRQSGGLMTQACCGNTLPPSSRSRSLFLYNLACQSTDDSSFLDNVQFIRISSLPVTVPFSCHDAALSVLEVPLSMICWPSWFWESFASTLWWLMHNCGNDAWKCMFHNIFLDKHTAARWVRMVRKTIISYVF